MRAELLYAATVKHGDLVAILDRCQSVSDDERSSWLLGLHIIESLLHYSLGLVVESTGQKKRNSSCGNECELRVDQKAETKL